MPLVGSLSLGFAKGQNPASVTLPQDRTFHGDELVLTVAVAEGPVAATLRQLALSMTIVSIVVWMSAAVCGRWLCRRALAPVFRMAASARAIRGRSAEGRFLEVGRTSDELEDLGTAFNELLVDLRELLEQQRRFTGDASHQLRTPLTAMLASVEVALRQERSSAEYRKILDVVRRRGGQLRQVIESLLFLARPEADSRPPEPELVDLSDLCQARVRGWEEHERAEDIRLHTLANTVVVRTHSALLGQVLDNLIDNALKYSEAGTPITVTVEEEPETVSLSVTDEGCGITAEELPHIFEPFYRTTTARWQGKPGVGLGLTVAYRLVGILGGKLDVCSESGKGSCFRITLPLATLEAEDGSIAQTALGGAGRNDESI
jgi:signal transduction histidine kinase